MTVQFSVTFSSLFVEYEYFVAFYQRRNYFTNYFSTINSRSTYSYCSIVVYQQYFFKFNSCAVFCVLNVVYKQFFALFSFELLTVNFYNYVHLFIILNGFLRKVECITAFTFLPHRTKSGTKLLYLFISAKKKHLLFSCTQCFYSYCILWMRDCINKVCVIVLLFTPLYNIGYQYNDAYNDRTD